MTIRDQHAVLPLLHLPLSGLGHPDYGCVDGRRANGVGAQIRAHLCRVVGTIIDCKIEGIHRNVSLHIVQSVKRLQHMRKEFLVTRISLSRSSERRRRLASHTVLGQEIISQNELELGQVVRNRELLPAE